MARVSFLFYVHDTIADCIYIWPIGFPLASLLSYKEADSGNDDICFVLTLWKIITSSSTCIMGVMYREGMGYG